MVVNFLERFQLQCCKNYEQNRYNLYLETKNAKQTKKFFTIITSKSPLNGRLYFSIVTSKIKVILFYYCHK